MMDILLHVEDLVVNYGGIKALQGIYITAYPGEIVTIIGANGAGKSSLLRAISGMVTPQQGKITFKNQDISRMKSHEIARLGISHVPEGRGVFAKMTVEENLLVATYTRKDATVGDDLRHVYQLFPRLEERKKQSAGTLSGGEQQMLAIGRALMSGADTLLLDEPSMGLAPVIVQEIFSNLADHQPGRKNHHLGGTKRDTSVEIGAQGLYSGNGKNHSGRSSSRFVEQYRSEKSVFGRLKIRQTVKNSTSLLLRLYIFLKPYFVFKISKQLDRLLVASAEKFFD